MCWIRTQWSTRSFISKRRCAPDNRSNQFIPFVYLYPPHTHIHARARRVCVRARAEREREGGGCRGRKLCGLVYHGDCSAPLHCSGSVVTHALFRTIRGNRGLARTEVEGLRCRLCCTRTDKQTRAHSVVLVHAEGRNILLIMCTFAIRHNNVDFSLADAAKALTNNATYPRQRY